MFFGRVKSDTNKHAELELRMLFGKGMHLISGKSPLDFNLALFQNASEELALCGSAIIL